MIYILPFNESNKETYDALYVTPILFDKEEISTLSEYDVYFRQSITELCKLINTKYKSNLVATMKRSPRPGLIIKNGNIQHIATDIYHFFNKKDIDVRIVYDRGILNKVSDDIDKCNGPLLIKINKYSEELKRKKGIFKA